MREIKEIAKQPKWNKREIKLIFSQTQSINTRADDAQVAKTNDEEQRIWDEREKYPANSPEKPLGRISSFKHHLPSPAPTTRLLFLFSSSCSSLSRHHAILPKLSKTLSLPVLASAGMGLQPPPYSCTSVPREGVHLSAAGGPLPLLKYNEKSLRNPFLRALTIQRGSTVW